MTETPQKSEPQHIQPPTQDPVPTLSQDLPTKAKTKDRQFVLVLIVLAIVFIVSAFGLIKYQQWKFADIHFDYNGFDITKVEHGYRIKLIINEQEDNPIYVRLRNKPQDVANITVDNVDIRSNIKSKQSLYVTIDPDQNLTGPTVVAALEIDSILDNAALFNIRVNSAFTKSKDPAKIIINCDDVNKTTGVIFLTLAEEDGIKGDNGCVLIQGKDEYGIIRSADAFLYRVMGVIPEGKSEKAK